MGRYEINGDTVKDTYTNRNYHIEEIPFLLNELTREAMITRRDFEHCIELKAVNRHLRIENRVLTMKLQELVWRSFGQVTQSEIEKELTTLCENPKEASEYIHQFEKENFELKQKLRRLGKYNDELL